MRKKAIYYIWQKKEKHTEVCIKCMYFAFFTLGLKSSFVNLKAKRFNELVFLSCQMLEESSIHDIKQILRFFDLLLSHVTTIIPNNFWHATMT